MNVFNRNLRNQMPDANLESIGVKGDTSIGVDKSSRIIRGYVVAELGPFKSPGRGEFDMQSLEKVVELGNAATAGLRSRFKHPGLSDDGLGKHLGRSKNFRMDGSKVRADLHLAAVALKAPPDGGGTPYGEYVMELANTDPAALSSSLVLQYKSEYRLETDGTRKKDSNGNPLPPIWRPTKLKASDVVDEGDAVNDFLSAENNLDENERVVRAGAELVEKFFDLSSIDRETLEVRLDGFKKKLLDHHFGEEKMGADLDLKPILDGQAKITEQLGLLGKSFETIAERLGSLAPTPKKTKPKKESSDPGDDDDDASDDELSAADIKKIVALCKMQGKPELASKFIEEGLSVESVKDALLKLKASESSLSDDKTGAENTDPKNQTEEKKLGAKIEKEWAEQGEVLGVMGITKEKFIANRKIELGLEPETSGLLLDKGKHTPVEILS